MRIIYAGIFLLTVSVQFVRAQGCSDAGFCTAGAMQAADNTIDNAKVKKSWGISLTSGYGENGTLVIAPQAEGSMKIGKRGTLDAKLPLNIATGKLGSHISIGDLIAGYSNYFFSGLSKWQCQATMGARIGLGDAGAEYKGMPLPMPYQSGLGTTDFIAGVNVAYDGHITFAVGYQQPLIQYNRNGYIPSTVYPAVANDNDYFASRWLRRKGDVLLRIEGNWRYRMWSFAGGPLLIYHLGEDNVILSNGNSLSLKGSDGLTLNLVGSLSYSFSNARMHLLAGTPLLVRDYRPDGLTRALVITLRYTHNKM